MSNSSLVTYTKITSHRNSPRTHAIDTITIHCYVGQVSAKSGCDYFYSTNRSASCNYVVGYDGSIGLCVPENDRSWCSSNTKNDDRAITIEVACDTSHPYKVTDKAYEALIKLVADVCKRNNIKKLVWSSNKSDRVNHSNGCNMTLHRDFKQKACPGQYLYERQEEIAKRVNVLIAPEIKYSLKHISGNVWRYYKNDEFLSSFTGIVQNEYGEWYVKKGVVDFGYTDVINVSCTSYYGTKENKYDGWYNIYKGQLMRKDWVARNLNGWWYCKNGKVDFSAITVAPNENGWWYCKNGKVDFDYTGLAQNSNGWWHIKGGKVDFTSNDVVQNQYGWWVVQNGKVNFNYTGLASNKNGEWYCKNGKVDFSYTGTYKSSDGVVADIKNGKVISKIA